MLDDAADDAADAPAGIEPPADPADLAGLESLFLDDAADHLAGICLGSRQADNNI